MFEGGFQIGGDFLGDELGAGRLGDSSRASSFNQTMTRFTLSRLVSRPPFLGTAERSTTSDSRPRIGRYRGDVAVVPGFLDEGGGIGHTDGCLRYMS